MPHGAAKVNTSGTLSLAALETLVHLNPPVYFKYVTFRIGFDEALVERMTAASLPPGWREEPVPPLTKEMGDLWVKQGRSAVLELPAVIIPGESNYQLNPAHPDFKKITPGKPERFSFDPRLFV